MPPQIDRTRRTAACRRCRERKVKCSGGTQCIACVRHEKECFYPPLVSRKRAKGSRARDPETQAESSTRRGAKNRESERPCRHSSHAHLNALSSGQCNTPQSPISTRVNIRQSLADNCATDLTSINTPFSRRDPYVDAGVESATETHPSNATQARANLNRGDGIEDYGKKSACSRSSTTQSEPRKSYYGPCSWISVFSPPGLEWVHSRAGTTKFLDAVNDMLARHSQRPKIMRGHIESLVLDLDEVTAWEFVNTYFDHSYESALGIVYRPSFEMRLQEQFSRNNMDIGGSSWFALQNVVYAIGCRILLSNDRSISFTAVHAQAWKYFERAMSVFSDLLFGPSSLTAVQALALMTVFVEGLGIPRLEYILCTTAAHVAQAHGLHQQSFKSSMLSDDDLLNRRWLWWAVYCLEKRITSRNARPSGIDDDNIGIIIPDTVAEGSTVDIETFTLMIKHAQLSSQISRCITSIRALQQHPKDLLGAVDSVRDQLQQLLKSFPTDLKVNSGPLVSNSFPSTARLLQALYIYCAIYDSLMVIHSAFFYPWVSTLFEKDVDPSICLRVSSWSAAVAEACRKIILAIRSVEVNAATPAWLAIYYPMYAHINLFIYILKDPALETVNSDLSLLEVSAGYFSYLEFITESQVSFTLPRVTTNIASETVATLKKRSDYGFKSPCISTQHASSSPKQMGQNIEVDTEDREHADLREGMVETNRARRKSNEASITDFDIDFFNLFTTIDVDSESSFGIHM